MKIQTFVFNPFQENTYVVYDENSLDCAIIDCGCYTKSEKNALKSFIDNNNLSVKYLLNTHLHIDHTFGNMFAFNNFGIGVQAHRDDEYLLSKLNDQAHAFGITPIDGAQPISKYLTEKDIISIKNITFNILHVPGHSPGSLCFYCAKEKTLFSGDVLFRLSIGRTDLPRGNFEQLTSGITQKLFSLPDDVIVYTGHGPNTTIGYEKLHNPFI